MQQTIKEAQEKESEALRNYLEKRKQARQSPYPTIIIEVRATPPMSFDGSDPAFDDSTKSKQANEESITKKSITKNDLLKLETLMGMPAASNYLTSFIEGEGSIGSEDIGDVFETPLSLAKSWISQRDRLFSPSTSVIDECGARHVDEAYEQIFSIIAKQKMESPQIVSSTQTEKQDGRVLDKRSYIVMPNFVSSSATSFSKFSNELNGMLACVPALSSSISCETMHPEEIENDRRSSVPILILQWYRNA